MTHLINSNIVFQVIASNCIQNSDLSEMHLTIEHIDKFEYLNSNEPKLDAYIIKLVSSALQSALWCKVNNWET